MKKLKKIVLNESSLLSDEQMKSISGGEDQSHYQYFLRCNQNSTQGVAVENCDRSTFERICGENVTNAVCVTTQY